MITLLVLTLLTALAAFSIRPPWREAIAILLVLLLLVLWLQWLGVVGHSGRWV